MNTFTALLFPATDTYAPGFLHSFDAALTTWVPVIFHGRAADLAREWVPYGDFARAPFDTAGVLADYLEDHPEDMTAPGEERRVIDYLRAAFFQRTTRPGAYGAHRVFY